MIDFGRSRLGLWSCVALSACGDAGSGAMPSAQDVAMEASPAAASQPDSVKVAGEPGNAASPGRSGSQGSGTQGSGSPASGSQASSAQTSGAQADTPPSAASGATAGATASSSQSGTAADAGSPGAMAMPLGSAGMVASAPHPDALTPDQLMQECGVAPAGLAPHIETIQSSKTPDVQLSMAIQGDPSRPPLVLVHGFPDFWCGWAPVIAELAQKYFVVAPDMRGYNRSSKPGNPDDPQDLAAYLMPELERDLADIVHYAAMQTQQKVSVVAHDWGAIVAWPFAHDYPEDLSRLMAVSVSHPACLSQFLASGDPALASAQTQQAQALTYISELVMNDSPAQFSADGYKKLFDSLDQKHLHKPNAFPEVEREAYKRMWDADNQASFKSQIKYYRANFGGAGGQAQTSDLMTPVPTAFIAPVYDGAILYPHSMDYLREHVAAEQPVLIRPIETGHFPQREEPARLAAMIRQFVDVDWQTP